MSGFPSWKPQAGAGPPFPSCLSFKHVPSKSPSLQTPPVEPSPDLLPRRPTFLRLATLKVPAQARTQILPPCPPPVRIQTTRNTQRHGWTQWPPVHTGGSTWSASDPGSQTSTNTAMYSPLLTLSLPQTQEHAQSPARGAHRHAQTQSHTGCAMQRNKCKPIAYCLPAQHNHHRRRRHRPARMQHRDTMPVPPVLLCTQPSIHSHTW